MCFGGVMRVLYDSDAHVDYAQIYVHSGWDGFADPLTGNFKGQVNGLCGGAEPGDLYMITGLHYGHVGFIVELHDEAPSIDDMWEEAVEVSFKPTSKIVALTEWGGESWPLLSSGWTTASGTALRGWMRRGRWIRASTTSRPIDRYLLQSWPAPRSADQVLKQTSAIAAYWHTGPANYRRRPRRRRWPTPSAGEPPPSARRSWKAENA